MRLLFKNIKYKKKTLLFFTDLSCILFFSLISHAIILTRKDSFIADWLLTREFLVFSVIMALLYSFMLYVVGLYEISPRFRKIFSLTSILIVSFVSASLFVFMTRVFNLPSFSLYILSLFSVSVALTVFINRVLFFKYIVSPRRERVNILLVGQDILTESIIKEIGNESEYKILGLLANGDNVIGEYSGDLKVVSTGKNLDRSIVL